MISLRADRYLSQLTANANGELPASKELMIRKCGARASYAAMFFYRIAIMR
jgi:hypothetical protein